MHRLTLALVIALILALARVTMPQIELSIVNSGWVGVDDSELDVNSSLALALIAECAMTKLRAALFRQFRCHSQVQREK